MNLIPPAQQKKLRPAAWRPSRKLAAMVTYVPAYTMHPADSVLGIIAMIAVERNVGLTCFSLEGKTQTTQ